MQSAPPPRPPLSLRLMQPIPMLLPRQRLLLLLLLLPRLLLLLPLLEHEEDRPRSLASAAAAERRTGIEPARAVWPRNACSAPVAPLLSVQQLRLAAATMARCVPVSKCLSNIMVSCRRLHRCMTAEKVRSPPSCTVGTIAALRAQAPTTALGDCWWSARAHDDETSRAQRAMSGVLRGRAVDGTELSLSVPCGARLHHQ